MEPVTTLPRGRALRAPDLEALPDDGHRYELVSGTLVVTPAPSHLHQRAVLELAVALRARCPGDLEVLVAPFEVRLDEHPSLPPDVLVARAADLTSARLPVAPRLAVEVASPSTRLVDLNLKKARLEAAGCPAYWVIDPEEPSLIAWELTAAGRYTTVADVRGDEAFEARSPIEVTIIPRRLVK